jgi:murein DD-endopeptidase MepM/ murein hydrolase activator NlpD
MPEPFTIAMLAAGAGVAAILAAKRSYADRFFAEGGVLPTAATAEQKAAAAQGTSIAPMTERGTASYLVQRGNFVRGLDLNRRTINPPYRITPHWGIDLAAPRGTPVYAVKTGRILHTGPQSGYGNTIHLDHLDGQSSVYAHLDSIGVREGQSVLAGQEIGRVGNSTMGPDGSVPFTTSPHLHWEIHRESPPQFGSTVRLDPVAWLRDHEIAQSGGRV